MADDDPNAPKTYKRYDSGAPAASTSTPAASTSTPAASTAPATVAADPNAPTTYKRPGSGTPPQAQPDPNAYKPPDWIPGANFLYKTNRVLENAFLPGADYLTAKAGDLARSIGISNTTPSVAQLRAETKQDRADVGPVASAVADTAGYMAGPGKVLGPLAGKLAPVAGRYGAAATEGVAANAVDEFGNQVGSNQPVNYWDTGKHILAGAPASIVGQGVGDLTAPIIRRVSNYAAGLPGRAAEQWDWRGLPPDQAQARIDDYRQMAPPASVAPGTPADKALTDTSNALAQSTDPGLVAHATQGIGTAAAAKFGLSPYLDPAGHLAEMAGLGSGGAISAFGVNPIARGVNTIDKNINTGQAFDRLYPALTGQQSTVDTTGWANALRQGWIGQQSQP